MWPFSKRKEQNRLNSSPVRDTIESIDFGPELRGLSGICDIPSPVDTSMLLCSRQPGALVVRLSAVVNNSPHAVWTSLTIDEKEVYLKFAVVQNPEFFLRSRKTVDVEWRIGGHADDMALRVIRSFFHRKMT